MTYGVLTVVYVGRGKRILIHLQGGLGQERYVKGVGWVVADDEEWNLDMERVAAIREAAEAMQLPLVASD